MNSGAGGLDGKHYHPTSTMNTTIPTSLSPFITLNNLTFVRCFTDELIALNGSTFALSGCSKEIMQHNRFDHSTLPCFQHRPFANDSNLTIDVCGCDDRSGLYTPGFAPGCVEARCVVGPAACTVRSTQSWIVVGSAAFALALASIVVILALALGVRIGIRTPRQLLHAPGTTTFFNFLAGVGGVLWFSPYIVDIALAHRPNRTAMALSNSFGIPVGNPVSVVGLVWCYLNVALMWAQNAKEIQARTVAVTSNLHHRAKALLVCIGLFFGLLILFFNLHDRMYKVTSAVATLMVLFTTIAFLCGSFRVQRAGFALVRDMERAGHGDSAPRVVGKLWSIWRAAVALSVLNVVAMCLFGLYIVSRGMRKTTTPSNDVRRAVEACAFAFGGATLYVALLRVLWYIAVSTRARRALQSAGNGGALGKARGGDENGRQGACGTNTCCGDAWLEWEVEREGVWLEWEG